MSKVYYCEFPFIFATCTQVSLGLGLDWDKGHLVNIFCRMMVGDGHARKD